MAVPDTPFASTIESAYESVGAFAADIIYLYSDLRSFGIHSRESPDRNSFCNLFIHPLLKRGKTVLMTTFTYTSQGRFDVLSTPTRLGALNKWILAQPERRRSEHPMFSYAALGPQGHLVENVGKSAFGKQSIFDRLYGRRASFLYVGRPVALGNTVIHFVEQICGATYRIHKAFPTEVYRGEQYIGTNYTAFVRRRDIPNETFEFDFTKVAANLFAAGLVQQLGSDDEFTNISFLRYDQTLDALVEMFYKDPRIFIKSDFVGY
jgi:aminoglycoside 3-N-acetyltransferase